MFNYQKKLQEAADGGDMTAMYMIGRAYYDGTDISQDLKALIQHLNHLTLINLLIQ